MIFPFFSRLVLYLVALIMPVVHPAIVVPYDWTGWWVWFLLVPGEMAIAFFLSPPRVKFRFTVILAGALLFISILVAGISGPFWQVILSGCISFLLTLSIFKTKNFGRTLAVFEQFFIAFVYYKLLNFSRASEETAQASAGVTQILLVVCIVSFLLHGAALFFAGFYSGERRRRRWEVLILSGIIPVFFALAFLLPPDFVKHAITFNTPDDDLIKDLPYDSNGFPSDRGGQNDRGRLRPTGREGEGKLQGVPSDKWSEEMGAGNIARSMKQYAVMIVISPVDPVYAAADYYGKFDPVKGFTYSTDEPLNELSYLRLIDTWFDTEPPPDAGRKGFDIRIMSTIPEKDIAYRPRRIEPTVLNKKYHPFIYNYDATSWISMSRKKDWEKIKGLTPGMENTYRKYLEIPVPEQYRQGFMDYLEKALNGKTGYYEKIEAILQSFKTFHYDLGFDDNVGTQKLYTFLTQNKRGDCTEFSNTAALLARMAGIPSRVVTGYLAAKNLQTPLHKRGILALQQMIEPLQQYPLNSLYLVTNAHHHSWMQCYMPGYGWIDFETTSYAIPPPVGGDLNSKDVVIPLIQDVTEEPSFEFPWGMILRVLISLFAAGIAGAYLFRYGKQILLVVRSREHTAGGLRALYLLLLMRLAADGFKVKNPAETAAEYAARYPSLQRFADVYTELRYRERISDDEKEQLWREMKTAYYEILRSRDRGIFRGFRRLFSLKGLYY